MSEDAYLERVYSVFADASKWALEHEPAYFCALCESPIEELFLYAIWANGCWAERVELANSRFEELRGMRLPELSHLKIQCVPQCEVAGYRVDFLLAAARANGEPPFLLAVECDGHDFHEKTKKQAARDKKRDRQLNDVGVVVYRFTGSELWRDAGQCARDVISKLECERSDSWTRHFSRTPQKESAE